MLNIVLVEPEIPQNTGNIARTCAATGCALHLVKPLGFSLDDKYMKRAGLDYWFLAEIHVHESWQDFCRAYPQARMFFATTKAKKAMRRWNFARAIFWCLAGNARLAGIAAGGAPGGVHPHSHAAEARSLNLSNSVAIVAYEALRQLGFPGLAGESDYTLPEWRDYV